MTSRLIKIFSAIALSTFMAVFLFSCSDSNEDQLGMNSRASECGGFEAKSAKLMDEEINEYCGDETLVWTYLEGDSVLQLLNEDIWLNCCGIHTSEIRYDAENDIYEIKQTDKPENAGRCDCMCLFDFAIDLPGMVEAASLNVKITRDSTDEEKGRYLVWEGIIDMSKGNGSILIEESVGWCDM